MNIIITPGDKVRAPFAQTATRAFVQTGDSCRENWKLMQWQLGTICYVLLSAIVTMVTMVTIHTMTMITKTMTMRISIVRIGSRFCFTFSNNMKSTTRVCHITNSSKPQCCCKVYPSKSSNASADTVILCRLIFFFILIAWLIRCFIGPLIGWFIILMSVMVSLHFVSSTITISRPTSAVTFVASSAFHQSKGSNKANQYQEPHGLTAYSGASAPTPM